MGGVEAAGSLFGAFRLGGVARAEARLPAERQNGLRGAAVRPLVGTSRLRQSACGRGILVGPAVDADPPLRRLDRFDADAIVGRDLCVLCQDIVDTTDHQRDATRIGRLPDRLKGRAHLGGRERSLHGHVRRSRVRQACHDAKRQATVGPRTSSGAWAKVGHHPCVSQTMGRLINYPSVATATMEAQVRRR